MDSLKVGCRVDIVGKNLKGTVAYVGSTQFAAGKWIGVILDVPKGKNNGTVQGKEYFTCDDNYGVFVRTHHISVTPDDSSKSSLKASSRSGVASKTKRRSIKLPQSETSRTPSPSTRTPSRLKTPAGHKSASRESSSEALKQLEMKSQARESPEPPPVMEKEPDPMQSISLHAGGISMVEYETVKAQAKDWKDKFETIRLKRQEDRAKMTEFEKMRVQLQQLSDWKTRSSESQQDLMKQLREAKKQAKEAVEARDRYIEDMSDVQETIEMATLDKEMAEEKVETLQQELELLKEQKEELQTDLEILKAEMEDGESDGASSYQVKQLEEQISRLKEALVRMRDLSSAEKLEHQKLEKEMEKKNKECSELLSKKKSLEEEMEEIESTMDELKEQVDASQMAEEMVEQLTDKNLKLEEKLVDLEEQVHDLETMNDMNEELQENARETEMELREELDLSAAKTKEALRKLDATTDIIGDYQDTIQKFRKMVQELQEANDNLRSESAASDDTTPEQPPAPPINYQIKMVETKAASRAIDLELRKMDAKLATDHVKYMSMFMPAMYNKQGGDRDCVQAILLVERIENKSTIVAKHIADRFDVSVSVDEPSELIGLRGEQVGFANELINLLNDLSVLMKKYKIKLGSCDVETFQKIGTLFSEMTPNERPLDYLAEQLRKDTLDETTNTSTLVKASGFFKHLYMVHLSKLDLDCWHIMDHHIILAQDLLRSVQFNCKRIKAFMKDGQQTSDVAMLLKDVETAVADLLQFCKKLRRRMPAPPTDTQKTMKFNDKISTSISETEGSLVKLNKLLYMLANKCSTEGGKISYRDVQAQLEQQANEIYNHENVYNSVRLSLGNMMQTINSLVTSMQEGEFDSTETLKKIPPPVEKRAENMKSSITTSESLVYKMEEKDAAISDLKKKIKSKADDVGECKIRIGMLERKLEIAGRESEELKSRLQQKIDTLNEETKKKKKEYDETMDALQADIDMLEAERAELKKRLVAQSKRSALDITSVNQKSPVSSIATVLAGAATATGSVPGTQVVVKDSPLLTEQIKALQRALRVKQMENSKMMGRNLLQRLKKLSPLTHDIEKQSVDPKIHMSLNKLTEELRNIAANPRVIDISKRQPATFPVGSNSPAQKVLQQREMLRKLQERVVVLQQDVQRSLAQKQPGGEVKRDFSSFPSKEFMQGVSPSDAVTIGRITLPSSTKVDYSKTLEQRDIVLSSEQLIKFHASVLQTV